MQTVIDRPSAANHMQQIVQTLRSLPPEKVAEVWDFVCFLQDRYAAAQMVDVADSWSEQDLQDLSRASLAYAESNLWEHTDATTR